MYKHLFGPVPSRRLGMSLGVDLVTHKICTLNCIYCECGKTTELTLQRREYVPHQDVIDELDHYFSNNPDPDYITFSGSGEPTLSIHIGAVIAHIKQKKPGISIALLTNGTLLNDDCLRKELLPVDLILPSLDAAIPSSFQCINRPHPEINLDHYIEGIAAFKNEFKGKMALEILILPGINDSPEDVRAIREACRKIQPDSVQLNTLDRPGVEPGIKAATRSELEQIKNSLGEIPVEIIASAPERKTVKSYRKDMEAAIQETIFRRPCTPEDLAKILGTHINEINKYLAALEAEGKIGSVRQDRGIFYQTLNQIHQM